MSNRKLSSVSSSALTGPSGYSGVAGHSGHSGHSGHGGHSGYSGTSGTAGIIGVDGASGYSGLSGHSGVSGLSGVAGATGATGSAGEPGISGFSGAAGATGTSGFSGNSGTSGSAGAAGASGASGTSGAVGPAGTSGYSGTAPANVLTTSNFSSYAIPLSGGTTTGQLNIGTSTNISFGDQVRQMLNLWSTSYGIGVQSNTTYFRSGGRFSWHRGGSHSDSENNAGGGTVAMTLDSSSNLTVAGGLYAPIFYDSNDTGYSCDPNGTSRFYAARTNIYYFAGEGGDSGVSNQGYALYQQGGAWSHPYPDLAIGFHTGIKIGAFYGYGGTRFYNNNDFVTIIASVGDGDNNFRSYYNIIAYASDGRLKENIQPIANAIEKVKKITGMTFDWKPIVKELGFEPNNMHEAGVIAQDVEAVLPEAIEVAPFDFDWTKPNKSKSGERYLTVKYEKLVPLLIEAIKEQQEQIEELKNLIKEKIS